MLITGANRGIGLELARQFAARGCTVIGTARDVAEARDLSAVTGRVERLDVADERSVAALVQLLDGAVIDILVNNAGVLDRRDLTLDTVDFATMEQTLAVNTLGPLRVCQALLPNLRAGRRRIIVNMSSEVGSIQQSNGRWYAYRASKSAEPGHEVHERRVGPGAFRVRRPASGLGAHRHGRRRRHVRSP